MANGIKITPEQLKEQAAQLTSLKEGYDNLFSNVSSDLNGLNGHWSNFLANNFLGKITSAQKSFSNVSNMLESGASAALQSAQSYADLDAVLAKLGLGTAESSLASKAEDVYKTIQSPIQDVNEALEALPEPVKKLIEWLKKQDSDIGDLGKYWSILSGFFDGDPAGFVKDLAEKNVVKFLAAGSSYLAIPYQFLIERIINDDFEIWLRENVGGEFTDWALEYEESTLKPATEKMQEKLENIFLGNGASDVTKKIEGVVSGVADEVGSKVEQTINQVKAVLPF